MTLEDILARVGGTIKRRYRGVNIAQHDEWQEVEVKNEDYAHYYFSLTQHGYEYQL